MISRSALLGSTAVALLLCAAPVTAQMQQKSPDEKGGQSQMQREPGAQKQQAPQTRETGKGEMGPGDAKGKAAQDTTEPKGKATKGTAEKAEPRDKATKGTAEKAEPRDKATKGTAEKAGEPKDKATKGTAEKAGEPKDKATKGTAEKAEPRDKATKGAADKAGEPKDKAAGAEPKQGGARVQVSEQQRTRIHQTLIKERNLNRANNVNISISIGSRVPRSVRLAALPASVIAIVPEYRRYQYVVVNERIVIVEPATYEVVEVIEVSSQQAARGGGARLVLTDAEKVIILREIDMRRTSTLGLGALSEGADVPRNVEVHVFPAQVVEKVPKLTGHRFFTAENRLAIVDDQGQKVQLVIEANR